MKKIDLETCILNLEEMRQFTDKLDYNTSVNINQALVKVLPLLKSEYAKLDQDKVDVNCPKFELITNQRAFEANQTIIEFLNTYMEQLVISGYTIIDFGYVNEKDKPYAYVKYTN